MLMADKRVPTQQDNKPTEFFKSVGDYRGLPISYSDQDEIPLLLFSHSALRPLAQYG